MAFDLKITFGGLCMLVQKKEEGSEQGLYVLMPDASDHGAHCRMMILPSAHSGIHKDSVEPLTRQIDSLRSSLEGGVAQRRPETVLAYSEYAKKTVDPIYFAANPPTNLGYRIALPLGSKIVPRLYTGLLNVPELGGTVARPFVGLVDVTFQVASPIVQINGQDLHADHENKIVLMLLNVPFSELYNERLGAKKDAPAHHVDAYYGLLDPRGTDPMPVITHAENKQPTPFTKRPCPDGKKETPCPIDWVNKGVDPNNCTIAWGCTSLPCP